MTVYSAESFFRAKISQSILKATACPITVRLSKLPTLTNWLLTISPNTENEEIVEYNNPQAGAMTIDIIKRGIKPDSILLTTNGVDYNNTTYQFLHTQNDIIRWDVNHIHINQGIGNSTLATNTWVGITKLSVAATDAWDPIAVGTNDPRLIPNDASTTVKWVTKLSVAPVSAANPIAVGDNDPRLINNIAVGRITLTNSTTTLTTYTLWFRPKVVKLTATLGSSEWPTSSSITYDWSQTITVYWVYNATNTDVRFRHDTQPWSAVLLRTSDSSSLINIVTVWFISTWFTLSAPSWTWYTTCSITYEAFA